MPTNARLYASSGSSICVSRARVAAGAVDGGEAFLGIVAVHPQVLGDQPLEHSPPGGVEHPLIDQDIGH